MSETSSSDVSTAFVDGIPVVFVEPRGTEPTRTMALWLPALSMTTEAVVPFLRRLANNGFVAVSFDSWQHGQRGSESGQQILERVFGNFRRYMWPILGQTTLDALRMIDWAIAELHVGPDVVAGGLSMGGDIAVALAGIDQRVKRVAAIVATPDWTRPGMTELADPDRLLPQGSADAYAQWFYDRLNPFTHLEAYARGPAMTFECVESDTHVPPNGAVRFQAALREAYPAAGERVRVNLHPGDGHMAGSRNPQLAENCLAWFLESPTTSGARG